MPENPILSEIFPKYHEFCELPGHAELRAYTIAAPLTGERLDPESPLRKTCQFIVVRPKDLTTWARSPGVDVGADVLSDDEVAPTFYRPSENPRSAKKYLSLFDDAVTLSISDARPFRTVAILVPRSLAIPDYRKFVGGLAVQNSIGQPMPFYLLKEILRSRLPLSLARWIVDRRATCAGTGARARPAEFADWASDRFIPKGGGFSECRRSNPLS
jgi:hypothetical protein